MDIRPDYVNIEQDGELVRVDPDDVEVGQIITVKPGERVPLDGIVLEGRAMLDTAALTGESVPREIVPGQNIMSGCIDTNGLLKNTVTSGRIHRREDPRARRKRVFEEISLRTVHHARFARWYTPLVTVGAVAPAVIPSLFDGMWAMWTKRALTFLVISCPCALVISVPLSF